MRNQTMEEEIENYRNCIMETIGDYGCKYGKMS
jgi:hypothetical protein